MDLNKNYYQALGLDKNATDDDIKKAYRKAAVQHHPDKGGDAEQFKIINEANTILSDQSSKHEYDNKSPHGKTYNPRSTHDFFGGGNPFEDMFRNFSSFSYRQEPIENLDIKVQLDVTLQDIYQNKNKEIKYTRDVPCSYCDATGFEQDDDYSDCETCGTRGYNTQNGTVCQTCSGTGKKYKNTCKKCSGSKIGKKQESINIESIFNLQGSQNLLYRGLGNFSKNHRNKAGSLVIYINEIPNDLYERTDNGDLIYNLNLNFTDAILGKNFELKHLDDKTYNIKIPEKTEEGKKFKLSGKGLLQRNGVRGDLIIICNIIIDYSKISNDFITWLKTQSEQ